MIAYIVVSSLLFFVVCFVCIKQIKRSNALENMCNTLVTNMQSISEIIYSSKELLDSENLKVAFSSDDEIGSFFKNLEEIQGILNNFILSSDVEKSKQD